MNFNLPRFRWTLVRRYLIESINDTALLADYLVWRLRHALRCATRQGRR